MRITNRLIWILTFAAIKWTLFKLDKNYEWKCTSNTPPHMHDAMCVQIIQTEFKCIIHLLNIRLWYNPDHCTTTYSFHKRRGRLRPTKSPYNHPEYVCVHSFIHQWLYSSLLGPGLFFSSVIFFYTDGMTPWTSDRPVARPLPTQHKHRRKRTRKHPCLQWDSNLRSQRSSERKQFMPHRWHGHCGRNICVPSFKL
jgi:hypothetical protein